MENKFRWYTIVLLILLALRMIGSLIFMEDIFFMLAFLAYLVSFIGVIIKQKWGTVIAIILACIDTVFAFAYSELFDSPEFSGIIIGNILIAFLAFLEYRSIKRQRVITNTQKSEASYCGKCGNKLDVDSKFCAKCGEKI